MKRLKRLANGATFLLTLLGAFLLTGCTVENVKQGLYEGIRTRDNLQNSPAERADKPETPDYLEYERLRKEQGYTR